MSKLCFFFFCSFMCLFVLLWDVFELLCKRLSVCVCVCISQVFPSLMVPVPAVLMAFTPVKVSVLQTVTSLKAFLFLSSFNS